MFRSFDCVFFFTVTATTEIYTLSLHDALPICYCSRRFGGATCDDKSAQIYARFDKNDRFVVTRSEERFSRNAETDLVCRLLLEKKKKDKAIRNSYADSRLHLTVHATR